jgi:hypothetical protein
VIAVRAQVIPSRRPVAYNSTGRLYSLPDRYELRAVPEHLRAKPTAEVEAIKRAIRFTRTCLRFAVTGAVVYGVCWAVQAVFG